MENDFSEVINKFSEILKDRNIDLNNLAGGNPPAENIDSSANSNDSTIDIETILKIKEIISKINKNQNSPRNNLLHALKPYLENDKQEKLEKYIKIANLLSILEDFDVKLDFFNDEKKGYDFILIITLFLLIL